MQFLTGIYRDVQSKVLQRIYNRTTPEEQRWIARIILKGTPVRSPKRMVMLNILADMVISVKENTVFSVFHPDAQDLFNTCSDLKKVAWELHDPNRRLKDEVSLYCSPRVLWTSCCTRTKQYNCSAHLHQCFVSAPRRGSRTL